MNDKNENNEEIDDFWKNYNNSNNENKYIFFSPENFNYDQNVGNWSLEKNNNYYSLYETLMDAIEEAISANFENEYINNKIKDAYFKINGLD